MAAPVASVKTHVVRPGNVACSDFGRGHAHGSVLPATSPTQNYLTSIFGSVLSAITLKNVVGDLDLMQAEEEEAAEAFKDDRATY